MLLYFTKKKLIQTPIQTINCLFIPRHNNELVIIESTHNDKHLFLVFHLMASNLRRVLYDHMRLLPSVCGSLIRQLLMAVSHLRWDGIIHKHIRPSSILIEHADIERPEYMRVILGGFQIARPTEIYEGPADGHRAHILPIEASPQRQHIHRFSAV